MANTINSNTISGSSVNTTTGAGGSTSSTNYSAGGEDALAALIQQLLGGGTAEQKASQANVDSEIVANRGTRAGYTKQAAFSDAEGAMNQQLRLAMEKLIPSLTRSAEGAGTSKSSMRALLLQDAASKSAESSAALGLKASVDYGNISSNLSQILAGLAKGTPVTDALLKAIDLSKGQSSQSVNSPSSSSSGSGSGNQNVNGNRIGSFGSNMLNTPSALPPSPDANFKISGAWGSEYAGESSDQYSNLYGSLNNGNIASASQITNPNGWSNYSF